MQRLARRPIGSLAVLSFLVLSAPAFADYAYHITDVGPVGEGFVPGNPALNNLGQVVGGYHPPNDPTLHGFLWTNGQRQDLGFLSSGPADTFSTDPRAINDSGVVVGGSTVDYLTNRPFSYHNGQMTELSYVPPSNQGYAFAINSSGQITGYRPGSGGYPRAYFYDHGAFTELGTLGGDTSRGYAINSAGQIVGSADSGRATLNRSHAFLYSDGSMTDLGLLPGAGIGDGSEAFGINAAGGIVGYGTVGNSSPRAFYYHDGVMRNLGLLGQDQIIGSSRAYAINDEGQIVGGSSDGSGNGRAFIFSNGAMADLNTMIDPSSGWSLISATSINDTGLITGIGQGPDGFRHYFLLSPSVSQTPEPSCLALGCTVLIAKAALRRRRPQ